MANPKDTFQEDLLGAIEDLGEVLGKQRAPEVNVDVPTAAAPEVNVKVDTPPAPQVNVAAPKVTVPPRKPCAFTVEVTERDRQNFIKKLVIKPIS